MFQVALIRGISWASSRCHLLPVPRSPVKVTGCQAANNRRHRALHRPCEAVPGILLPGLGPRPTAQHPPTPPVPPTTEETFLIQCLGPDQGQPSTPPPEIAVWSSSGGGCAPTWGALFPYPHRRGVLTAGSTGRCGPSSPPLKVLIAPHLYIPTLNSCGK